MRITVISARKGLKDQTIGSDLELPEGTMLGFATLEEAVAQFSNPECEDLRPGSVWVRGSNPTNTWWYVGLIPEQYYDGSWELQVVAESDAKGRPNSTFWLREFNKGFAIFQEGAHREKDH